MAQKKGFRVIICVFMSPLIYCHHFPPSFGARSPLLMTLHPLLLHHGTKEGVPVVCVVHTTLSSYYVSWTVLFHPLLPLLSIDVTPSTIGPLYSFICFAMGPKEGVAESSVSCSLL